MSDEDKLDTKEIFLQNDTCYNTSLMLPQCKECTSSKNDCNKYICRFYQFRKIEQDNGIHRVVGYLDKHIDTSLADIDIWTMPDNRIKLTIESRNYLLRCVASQFCEMVREENDLCKMYSKTKENLIIWKRAVFLVREMCDVCATSIFNFHFVCSKCGTSVCIDCYKERTEGIETWKLKTRTEREERDKFFWLKCHNDEQHNLILTQMIPGDSLNYLNENMHKICDEQSINLLCECRNRSVIKSNPHQTLNIQRIIAKTRRERLRMSIIRQLSVVEKSFAQIDHKWIAQRSVLKLLEPSESHYDLFQSQWERGKPVVVANAKRNMREFIWTPEYFLLRCGENKHSLVNCENDTVINRVSLKHFWRGFQSYRKRLPLDLDDKLVLKLKDWPTASDFADVMKDHFDDMMRAVPFQVYTRRDGNFNLARYLHEHFSKADLGPKIYCAYGQSLPPKQGSTNLHLDVSDAINILVHVSQPTDAHLSENQYKREAVKRTLESAGCDEEDIKIFMSNERLPGAIWYIWHSSKANDMRRILREVKSEQGKKMKKNDDPLHDQDCFIDDALLLRLKQNGIEPYTIVQYQGDSIFIPAGAPHQVTNIFDCIKVALDFVSPENLTQCFQLTSEFRQLSSRHANREDKLQIKSILYHVVKCLVPKCENDS